MKRGKLIVIDGSDGSGKATQTRLLIARLKKAGRTVRTLDFPQYEKHFFGKLIGECLTGVYGNFIALDPHIASVLYAADRFESKQKIERWLRSGALVVLDRYVSANQIHQGGKLPNAKQQREFLKWLDTLEYKVFGLPRPDMIVYLDVPVEVAERLLRQADTRRSKVYLKQNQKDVAESSPEYLRASRVNALKLVKQLNQWVKIDGTKKNDLLSREVIAEKVWQAVKPIL